MLDDENNSIHNNTNLTINVTTSNHNNSATRKQLRNDDLNNQSMQSIRQAMNIKSDSSILSIYSPKTCPICMESYHTDDEIAWSSNEECAHAFHLACIMKWLMNNSNCPMCRSKFV